MIYLSTNNLNDLDPFIMDGRGYIDKITTHWTGCGYDELDFPDYHVVIDQEGTYHVTRPFNEKGAHTWRRNTGNLGVSMACCDDALTVFASGYVSNWGDAPPTKAQIEATAQLIGYLAIGLGVRFADIHDHHHYARLDGYGSERVDVMSLPSTQPGAGMAILKGKAKWYIQSWGLEVPE